MLDRAPETEHRTERERTAFNAICRREFAMHDPVEKSQRLIRIALVTMVLVSSISLLLVVGLYAANFGGQLSDSPDVWGQFGDYLGGVLNPFLSLIGLIGLALTLYANVVALRQSRQSIDAAFESVEASRQSVAIGRDATEIAQKALEHQIAASEEARKIRESEERTRLLVDLLLLWMSPEMQIARGRAWDFIKKNLKQSGEAKPTYMGQYRHTEDADEKADFSRMASVYHFLADVHTLIAEEMIDERLTWQLIGRSAIYWLEMLDSLDFREHEHDSSEVSANSNKWYNVSVRPLHARFKRYQATEEIARHMGLPAG